MKILQLSLTELAGMPSRLWRGLQERAIPCRLVTFSDFFFPTDQVSPTWGELQRLIAEADLVHVHSLTTYGLFAPELMRKNCLVHIHGVPDRGSRFRPPVWHVVSTPDLLDDFPEAVFLPNLILPQELPAAAPPRPGGPVRIFKSPSLHDKHQELCARLVQPLVARFPRRVEYIAPRSLLPHCELARLRARCHISLDHLHGYYGLESLEALAQGLIPVNGATDQVQEHLARVIGQAPPFAIARDAMQLGQLLVELVEEALLYPARFAQRCARGPRYIHQHYQPEQLMERWLELYGAVIGKQSWPPASLGPEWLSMPPVQEVSPSIMQAREVH